MANLADFMPPLNISGDELKKWGNLWLGDFNPETSKAKQPQAFDRQQSVNFASFIDIEFAKSLAVMLGGIPVERPRGKHSFLLRRIASKLGLCGLLAVSDLKTLMRPIGLMDRGSCSIAKRSMI